MKTLVLVVVLAGGLRISAVQAQSRADSLEAQLAGAAGPARLALLADLVEETYRNDPGRAVAYGREALALLTTYPDVEVAQRVLFLKGQVHYFLGEPDSVLAHAGRLETVAAGSEKGRADASFLRSLVQRGQSDYAGALVSLEAALSGYEAVGDVAGEALALENIGRVHRLQGHYDAAFPVFERALARYEALGDRQGIASVLYQTGVLYRRRRDYDQALSYYTRALAMREELGDTRGLALSFNSLGVLYRLQGDYDQALSYYTRALALREELGDKQGTASSLNNIGLVHDERGEYAEALSFFTRSLPLYEDLSNTRGMATSLARIGNIYENQGDYAAALDFLARSLALREELGDKQGIASSLHNIGNIHFDQGRIDESLSFYTRSLALKEELGSPNGLAVTLISIGTVYRRRGDYEAALASYTRALNLYKDTGDREGQAIGFSSLGALYLAQGRLDEALAATDRAVALTDSIGALPYLRSAHQQRADILERQGRFAEALAAYRAYHALHDSLFNSESQGVIAELQAQYRTKEQQQRIELLETRRSRQRLWVTLLLGGVGLLMVIIGLQVARMRLRRRALAAIEKARRETEEKAEELRRANELKSRFLANISHEFRTPLTLTFGPLDDLLQGRFRVEEAARPHLERARRNGGRLLRLINQLLDLSKLDAGALLLRPRRHDLAGHLRQLAALFDSIAEMRAIGYATKIPESPLLHVYDLDKVEKVVINLLSNAFKFTPPGGRVSLVVQQEEGGAVCLEVADTGPGIAEEHVPHLFDRFYQVEGATTRSHEGSGIGLALVKELVELHEGTIAVQSTVGFGTRFIIGLPVLAGEADDDVPADAGAASWEALPDAALREESVSRSLRVAHVAPPGGNGAEAKIPEEATVVLVVEDNDDMRAYIRGHLEDLFTVVEAEDGRAGIARAQELVPDLVMSDVMMPEMDGLDLCTALKRDERTSHIPVVLLTARAQVEHRVEGFESGADAYLAKPFNAEELRVRVRTLIEERRRLRRLFVRDIPDEAGEPSPAAPAEEEGPDLPPREAAFVAKVEAAVIENLDDTQFSVDRLAEGLHLSARQLLRKLRALTGGTPAEVIRRLRMEEAARLLKQGELSVKEIGYQVGYQSSPSFARAFRETYGCSPTHFVEQHIERTQ